MFFASRPGALPCHPERSGTTNQYSSAPTNHCRTANPVPQTGRQQAGSLLFQRPAQRTPPTGTPHIKHRSTPLPVFPDGGMRYTLRSNNGDPACGRPARGAGFDCAALFGCRVRPYTRCAASLRMTRRVAGARDGKQNAVSVSLIVLYFEPNKLRTTFHPTHCVILSEAAPPTKNHARQPIIAAQSNPAPSGAPAGGISIAKRRNATHHLFVRVPVPPFHHRSNGTNRASGLS